MLLVFSRQLTNRLKYTLDYILSKRLGIDYSLTDNIEIYNEHPGAKLAYTDAKQSQGVFLYAFPLLFENNIYEVKLNEQAFDNSWRLFSHKEKSSALSFDVFAAVFYLLSGYEEYVYPGKDQFGNFDYRQSILHKLDSLDKPLVDEWIGIFKTVLNDCFPSLKFKEEKPRYLLSFDIDVAYEYKNRGLMRTVAGLAKKIVSLKFKNLKEQVLTLLNKQGDSFDTYQYIEEKIAPNRAIFFFNLGKYGKFDKNPSHKNQIFRSLIYSLNQQHFVGLHPSYASNYRENLLTQEKQKLEDIIKEKVTVSRQHYLKISTPRTFLQLVKNGITTDFSIGYYLNYGFRAGTCHPFLFFDLSSNEATNLRLYPFAFMDGTLNDVLKLSPAEAKLRVEQLMETVKKCNGVFIPLWHNSTLSETSGWKCWRDVFEHMLKQLEEKKFEPVTNIKQY